MKAGVGEVVTVTVRLVAFGVALVPFGALFLPWVTLDGSSEIRTGVTSISLLVSPIRGYLFEADPVQAAIVTIGPVAVVLLTIITGSRYYSRRSTPWTPLLMLAMVLAIIYLTENLVRATHEGLNVVTGVAVLLILHQAAIRLQVTIRRRSPFSKFAGILAIATGVSYRRRWR